MVRSMRRGRGAALILVLWLVASLSLVVWKMAPPSSSCMRRVWAFTRLPLWHSASAPCKLLTTSGWAFSRFCAPVVP